ncbi:flavin reductase [Mesorhizobium sp. YR577]|uniref:flavin reductase n=1 Tax=Mesorhizobium sp. YR577 TaxID=1884373 RepID=UPI001FCD7FB6|nr:flavin reductase [Mesorhizobium sp. YR577]
MAEAFLTAFRHHPSGVAIITADPGDGPVALTLSSLISISVSPPTVAFSLSDNSSSAAAAKRAETIVVHFARQDDMQLAQLCATSGKDRFGDGVRWERLATGEPYYPQVDLWFRAAVRERFAVPGACIVTAELLEVSSFAHEMQLAETLVYANRRWHGLHPLTGASRVPILLWPDDSATF